MHLLLTPDSPAEIELHGSSNLHRWTCTGSEVKGLVTANIPPAELSRILQVWMHGDSETLEVGRHEPDVNVHIWLEVYPRDLDCPSRRMRLDLLRAIQVDQYPSITYWFSELIEPPTVVDLDTERTFELKVAGYLSLAGERRRNEHTAKVRQLDSSTLELSGKLYLNMKDFGIDPPTALMGLLRAHEEFDVAYRFTVPLEGTSLPDALMGNTDPPQALR